MAGSVDVGIISVGAELVSGDYVDTNAQWLAQRVNEAGCRVVAELLVGDERPRLVEALEWMADRADILVIGGGLGPTADDITRFAVADFAGVDLVRDAELERRLHESYTRYRRRLPPTALCQADVPAGATIHEPLGTAAAFTLEVERSGRLVTVHVVPGVPWEFKGVVEAKMLPDLVQRSGGQARVTRTLHIAGIGESGIGEALRPISDRLDAAADDTDDPEHGIALAYLAKSDEVLVRVSATGSTPDRARARAEPVVGEVSDILGDAVTSVDDRRLEDEVRRLLDVAGLTVATVETFTAGHVAALLSDGPGGTAPFRGGVVATTTTPAAALGLPEVDLRGGGREAAVALARTAKERFDADIGLATTLLPEGVEGDGGEGGGPGGRKGMWAAWALVMPGGEVASGDHFLSGDRQILETRGAAMVLAALRRTLVERRQGR